ncbi:flagellar hook-length control protein FliK [Oceanisphaera marina]|uniref:Flagellar hook-length control protein FliK n=1 Tax=Oceanisphaera marina TaxID=2017550 RepID=A0ABQ1ILM2_9GAMM|nr:flagellar hook-length control protein FliK [Oceanisphaera marina]GGB45198.1 flagellar hook-length control protein FliK [Oceanisphaera marina]
MTMNIMSVRIQAGQEAGGKITDAMNHGEAGLFAEVFTQESTSQQAASVTAISQHREESAERLAAEQQTADKPGYEAIDGTSHSSEDNSQPISLLAPNTVLQDDSTEPRATLAKDDVAKINNKNAADTRLSTLASTEQTHAHGDEAGDAEKVMKAGSPQGGSSLPPGDDSQQGVSVAAGGDRASQQTTDADQNTRMVNGSQIATHSATTGQAVAEGDAEANEASRKPLSESTDKQATPSLQATSSSSSTRDTSKLAPTADVIQTAAEQTKNQEATSGSSHRSGHSESLDGQSSTVAGSQATRSAQSASGATSQAAEAVTQASNQSPVQSKAAQALAGQANLVMEDNGSEAESSQAQANKVPADVNTAASATAMRAPEWLAQIEHGRRWGQSASSAVAESPRQDAEGKAMPLGEKTATEDAKADSRLSLIQKEASSPLVSEQKESVSVSQPASAVTADTVTNSQTAAPQEAGLMMSARDSGLSSATVDRPPVLDRALTLHGSAEQNAKQLAQQAQVVVSQNLQEADIRLNPSELGGLKIQIKMEQGEVQVQFVASSPQAKELIEQAMPRLREMLNQQGMNLGQQGQGQQSGQQQAQGQNLLAGQHQAAQQEQQQRQGGDTARENGQGYSPVNDVDVNLAENARTQRVQADSSRIDFFA